MNDDMDIEIRDVKGFEGRYGITNDGRVYSYLSHKFMKAPIGKRGYKNLNLRSEDGKTYLKYVHRLVAEAFISNPCHKAQVNHIDGNKTNNCVSNLEWCTSQENLIHARKTGLHTKDGDKSVKQLKNGVIIAIFKSASEASRKTKINRSDICNVCRKYEYKGKHWKTAGGYEWEWV